MVLHRPASSDAPHFLRLLGVAAAYAAVMATGTALLIAALASSDERRVTGPDGLEITAADVVMQQAAQRAMQQQPQQQVVLASRTTGTNDKRGL
jgi:parvulin-like peptidyl-prolyl isomerase